MYRQFQQGHALDRDTILRRGPATGDLALRIRLIGRNGPKWNVYLATLSRTAGGDYVIPCMDRAVLTEIKGRWLHFEGSEVIPRSTSQKRPNPDYYPQAWWCRLG